MIEESEAQLEGTWTASVAKAPFVGNGYHHDGNSNKGRSSARFEAKLTPGRFEVRMAYSADPNRASNVPVTIHFVSGEQSVRINQRNKPDINGTTVSLGVFDFGESGAVVISNEGTDGYVIIDAVQFLRKDD